jgi:hypothetical protein
VVRRARRSSGDRDGGGDALTITEGGAFTADLGVRPAVNRGDHAGPDPKRVIASRGESGPGSGQEAREQTGGATGQPVGTTPRVTSPNGGSNKTVRSMTRNLPFRECAGVRAGPRERRAQAVRAKAMDGVKDLDSSPHELLGIAGAERLARDDGNGGSPPRPNRHHVPGITPPENRRPPGRGGEGREGDGGG